MSDAKQVALIFPGQGSQAVGMLGELYNNHSIVQATFNDANEALGEDLWALIKDGPQDQLNLTKNAQPALLTSSVAIFRLLSEMRGLRPSVMAGHSLGEWSALVCAGALDFADAVRLVRARGEFMQQAVPVGEGSMAAVIGLDDQSIEAACAQASSLGVVAAVNYNSPGQVVIAGQIAAIDQAIKLCQEAGAKRALSLPVSAPFHTSLMQPAAEQLANLLAEVEVRVPAVPVIHNVHAKQEQMEAGIRQIIIEQIYSPVRWVECVNAMQSTGVDCAIECGPGKVLGGLLKRIDKSWTVFNSDSLAAQENLQQEFAIA